MRVLLRLLLLLLLALALRAAPAPAQDALTLVFSANTEGEYAPCPT